MLKNSFNSIFFISFLSVIFLSSSISLPIHAQGLEQTPSADLKKVIQQFIEDHMDKVIKDCPQTTPEAYEHFFSPKIETAIKRFEEQKVLRPATYHFLAFNRTFPKLNLHEVFFEYHVAGLPRLLFLADGGPLGQNTLANKIAKNIPWAAVFKTDITLPQITQKGNVLEVPLDNTQPFPFEDNFFDVIVMQNGLCQCYGSYKSKHCGGLQPTYQSYFQFFSEVARVLNKNNPSAHANFHGELSSNGFILGINGEMLDLMKTAAKDVIELYPQVEIHFLSTLVIAHSLNDKSLYGIRFSIKDTTEANP